MVYGFVILGGMVLVLAIDTILRDRRRCDEVIAAVRGYSEREQRKLDDVKAIVLTLEFETREARLAQAKKPVKRGK